jgi:uncharacterized protein
MKRTFLCLLIVFFFAGSFAAAAQPGITEITASGAGSVSLPPDIATVMANVETNAPSASDATSQSNQIYDHLVSELAKLGIAREDIALSYYNVNYNPRPQVVPPDRSGERFGYTVTRSFVVKVRKIGEAGAVTDACVDSGATSIGGVHFGLSNSDAARAQAITRAVANARANAEALARAASLRIISIKSIELADSGYTGPQGMVARVETRAAAPTDFDQSNVNVIASVKVVFVAQP